MSPETLLPLVINAGAFIAAFAAIAAGIIMSSVRKQFGTGILATGFKTIATGVFFIAGGIIIDAVTSYLQINASSTFGSVLILKYVLFVTGTYVIVVGSKQTADKLESLTK
ncbi:MAG: hypothetical protein HYT11_01630 [Candidatus Levybacteria bacterium]|nr:hypothetical protein [Candidatus Levybacteria bacterium]